MSNQSEFCLIKDQSLHEIDEELKEIEVFFDDVKNIKDKIIKDKQSSELNGLNSLKSSQIIKLLNNHLKLFNVISESTVRIYIDSIFEQDGMMIYQNNENYENNDDNLYKFTEEALETFLTSILIYKQD